jgi:hypothetical protein
MKTSEVRSHRSGVGSRHVHFQYIAEFSVDALKHYIDVFCGCRFAEFLISFQAAVDCRACARGINIRGSGAVIHHGIIKPARGIR